MIIGTYYCFFGYRFMKVSMWGVGFISFFSIVFFGMNAYRIDIWWFNAIVATIVGFLVSWVLFCFDKSLPCLLGFICGFTVSAQFFGGFIALVWNVDWFIIVLWCTSVFFGVLYAMPSTYLSLQQNMKQKYIMIINTSIFGGFLFSMALDFFAQDGFSAVIPQMFAGQVVLVYPWYLSMAFVVTWIIFAVFGSGIQRMVISSRTFYYKPKVPPLDDAAGIQGSGFYD